MRMQLNRQTKIYCPDFAPIRELLRDVGATFVELKHQVDYYYNLPDSGDAKGTQRLKYRVENDRVHIIYFYDRQVTSDPMSRFQLWRIRDPDLREVLDVALGVRVIVRKQRELWRKENIEFNLDTVEGVGQILEVEIQEIDGCDIEDQVKECRILFGPYLGSNVDGANEDLVTAPK